MSDCEQPCEDCTCGEEEETEPESETPSLDLLEQLQALSGLRGQEDTERISIDRDNAGLYAFSDIELKTMREGKEVATNPLEWSHQEIALIASQVVGNKLDV
jgi:hypothetical protein